MRGYNISITVGPLVLGLLFLSCNGQHGTLATQEGAATSTASTIARPAEDTAQLAEYVVEAFEDSKGNLWFGTIDKGVSRYDGRTLTYFTEKDGLCGNTVTSIVEDDDGNLWFGTHSGICMYDGRTFTGHLDAEGSVRASRDGTIWASTNTSVLRFAGHAFSEFHIPVDRARIPSYSIVRGRTRFALEDSKGNLWFATDGAGAFMFDGRSFTQFTKNDGLCSNTVWSMLEDAKGDIWFACIQAFQPAETGDGGLCTYDGQTFTRYPDVQGLSGNDIYTLHKERSGNIWIGATHLGAYRYNGETFTLFDRTDRPDLTMNFGLQAMLEDRKGMLWCGFSGGLFRFNGASFMNVRRGGPWTDP